MSTRSRTHESSAAFGAAILAVAAAVWTSHFAFGVFDGWGWALVVGSAWTILGLLLLFSDVRLYLGVRSPAERYHRSGGKRRDSLDD